MIFPSTFAVLGLEAHLAKHVVAGLTNQLCGLICTLQGAIKLVFDEWNRHLPTFTFNTIACLRLSLWFHSSVLVLILFIH